MEKHRNSLQPGYRLHWYIIKKILGQGGFGITYLAEDTNLNQLVAIKEYLPVELAVRDGEASIQPVSGEHGDQYKWGLDRFKSEAQTLARFKHQNIIRVFAVFEENNSAYMVMEFEQGRGLHEILKEKKTLPETELTKILLPILDGLEAIHASNFIHRDIKPPNIYIRENGTPVLLDFGSARQSLGLHTRTLTTMVSPGYAPFEQYVSKSDKQGPWTDIYGLGATLYRSVTGISPSESMDRSEALLHSGKDVFVSATEIASDQYSALFLQAIDHALAFKPEDRPQNISAWRLEFGGVLGKTDTVENIVGVSSDNNESEAETFKVNEKTEVIDQPDTEIKTKTFTGQWIDRIQRSVKKLLKWGAIFLLILIVLGILNNSKKNKQMNETFNEQQDIQEQDNQAGVPVEITDESEPSLPVKEKVPVDPGSRLQNRIKELLAGAEVNIGELRLTTPAGNNAVEKYQTILDLEPGNREALNGLDRVVDEYIQLMDNALLRDNIPAGQNYLNKGARVNPLHSGIEDAQERINSALVYNQQQISDIPLNQKQEKKQDVDEQTLTDEDKSLVPESERQAISDIRQKIIQNPDDRQARRELRVMAKQVEEKIKKAIEQENHDLAEDYVEEILKYTEPDSKKSRELKQLLNRIKIKKMEKVN